MNNIISIPIKPHLKKFVLKHIYNNQLEPIKVEQGELLGKFVMVALKLKTHVRMVDVETRAELSDTLQVKLASRMERRNPTPNRLASVNPMLDDLFRCNLLLWIKSQKMVGYPATDAIRRFLAFYDIEEKYSFDAAARSWQRHLSSQLEMERKIRNRYQGSRRNSKKNNQ